MGSFSSEGQRRAVADLTLSPIFRYAILISSSSVSSLRQKLSLSKESHECDQCRRYQRQRAGEVHGGSVGSDAVVGASACFQDVARDW